MSENSDTKKTYSGPPVYSTELTWMPDSRSTVKLLRLTKDNTWWVETRNGQMSWIPVEVADRLKHHATKLADYDSQLLSAGYEAGPDGIKTMLAKIDRLSAPASNIATTAESVIDIAMRYTDKAVGWVDTNLRTAQEASESKLRGIDDRLTTVEQYIDDDMVEQNKDTIADIQLRLSRLEAECGVVDDPEADDALDRALKTLHEEEKARNDKERLVDVFAERERCAEVVRATVSNGDEANQCLGKIYQGGFEQVDSRAVQVNDPDPTPATIEADKSRAEAARRNEIIEAVIRAVDTERERAAFVADIFYPGAGDWIRKGTAPHHIKQILKKEGPVREESERGDAPNVPGHTVEISNRTKDQIWARSGDPIDGGDGPWAPLQPDATARVFVLDADQQAPAQNQQVPVPSSEPAAAVTEPVTVSWENIKRLASENPDELWEKEMRRYETVEAVREATKVADPAVPHSDPTDT